MFDAVLRKFFGSKNDRELSRLQVLVETVNNLEKSMKALDDQSLAAKTEEFRSRLASGETLDYIMPEAFAVVREAAFRVLGMRHFDVQIMGGAVLHAGKVAEMRTGEGKTLVSTLPAYLNALEGKGVHVVTVNDYLAQRDCGQMGQVHKFLGLTVGCIVHGQTEEERRAAYRCDITYGTNSEFGFDYLRDNMKYSFDDRAQRTLHYAIIDEVDSILIDEARTPLIISGPADSFGQLYQAVAQVMPRLEQGAEVEPDGPSLPGRRKETTGDYTVDEKSKSAHLTDAGVQRIEDILGIENLYTPEMAGVLHHIEQALRAHALYIKDRDYVVKDGEVLIVDEFTGRLMPGRRWSDGLHQAIEAKEGVKVNEENQTLASITLQNLFRMYGKLSGMTGTADTEAAELYQIYKLAVVVVPTNRPMIRVDHPDLIYKSLEEKYAAVVEDIILRQQVGQPVLVGTISVERSEYLSELLKKRGVKHNVLNAKNHGAESLIVAQAGRKGAVTIATNMAGRGTDIILGGNPELLALSDVDPEKDPDGFERSLAAYRISCSQERDEVLSVGGLYILGTERHESRRIDNQLRGRSGRQGDDGESRFYLCLEDDLMRMFGSDKISRVMEVLKFPEGEPIEHKLITGSIAKAQSKVEAHNFDIRKHLLEYDDVMNTQREAIYAQREEVMNAEEFSDYVDELIEDVVEDVVEAVCPSGQSLYSLDVQEVEAALSRFMGSQVVLNTEHIDRNDREALIAGLLSQAQLAVSEKSTLVGQVEFDKITKLILLQGIDHCWKTHLLFIDQLKEGIGLRSYAQKNPKEEFKREAYQGFMEMMSQIRQGTIMHLLHLQLVQKAA